MIRIQDFLKGFLIYYCDFCRQTRIKRENPRPRFECFLEFFFLHFSPYSAVYGRLGNRRLGDKFLDDHLGDTGWTFGRQQLDV